MLGHLAQQRELEEVMHDQLNRIARAQRKAEEDNQSKLLQDLKSKMSAY